MRGVDVTKGIGACLQCGATVVRKADRGVIPAYCEDPNCYRRCTVAECEAQGRTKGLCSTHYTRFRKHGDPLADVPPLVRYKGRLCKVEDCHEVARTRDYCPPHYHRFMKYGDPLANIKPPVGDCAIDYCERPAKSRGWCHKHYHRWIAYGDPLAVNQLKQFMMDDPDRPKCSIEGCERDFKASGLCRRHLYRLYRYGSPTGKPEYPAHVPCKTCGTQPPHSLYREYCSNACYWAYRNWGGKPTLSGTCFSCSATVEYLFIGRNGEKRYQRRQWCHDCQMRARRAPHAMDVHALARRDGNICGICREEVDMTLSARSAENGFMGPSVDHVTPLSRGGLNVPENLQLSHLRCNISKRDKTMDEFLLQKRESA